MLLSDLPIAHSGDKLKAIAPIVSALLLYALRRTEADFSLSDVDKAIFDEAIYMLQKEEEDAQNGTDLIPIAYVYHETSAGISAPNTIGGAWRDRPISNLVPGETGITMPIDNRLIIPAGLWRLRGYCTFYGANDQTQCRIVSDDNADVIAMSDTQRGTSGDGSYHCIFFSQFGLLSDTMVKIQYRTVVSVNAGLGYAVQNFASPNTFMALSLENIG